MASKFDLRHGYKAISLGYPGELRIGQNLSNFISYYSDLNKTDLFYVDDTKFLKQYNDYLEWMDEQKSKIN